MDWIKVCKNTPDKPAIRHAARVCGVSQADAFLAWFRLWTWLDSATADGSLPLSTADDLDDVAGVKGIAAAFAEAGWLELTQPSGVIVMHWDRHNGKSAKKRALDAKRKQETRERTGEDSGFRPWRR